MVKLHPQQEKFAQYIAKGMTQSDAFRKAYPKALKYKEESIWSKSSNLAASDKVKARVAELKAPVIAKLRYELEDAMREAEEARLHALKDNKGAGAAVAATALKAKLNGLMVEDRKNERRPLGEMSDDELTQMISDAAERAGMHLNS